MKQWLREHVLVVVVLIAAAIGVGLQIQTNINQSDANAHSHTELITGCLRGSHRTIAQLNFDYNTYLADVHEDGTSGAKGMLRWASYQAQTLDVSVLKSSKPPLKWPALRSTVAKANFRCTYAFR